MLSYMVRNQCKRVRTSISLAKNTRVIVTMAKDSIRWAFNAKTWQPTKEDMLAASSYIQPEEKQRIAKFVFKDDAKSSLIGRLLMRKFIHISTSIPYEEIRFGRDDSGKPYLLGAGDMPVSFNISHQGDYVVLAGSNGKNIGVDTMKIEPPANKNIPEFFRLMNRQFSSHEWSTVKRFPTELEQISCFYRLWCLKESYVKNVGVGITIPLHEISFRIKTRDLKVDEIVTDTTLYIKNELKEDWLFEETLLDDKHAVAVALQGDRKEHIKTPFTVLRYEDIVKEAKPLFQSDQMFSEQFMKKQIKHF